MSPAILLVFFLAPATENLKPPVRGSASAVNVERGPACDGNLEDPLWTKCPPWPLGDCTSESPHKYKTWTRILFDGTHVHVGLFCEEPDTEKLVMNVSERDGPVWNDDSVEVFLRPDPQERTHQFAVNPRGVLYDARNRDPAWNSSAGVRASIQNGRSWTATLKIPLKEIGAYAGEDQIWTLNVYRTRPARGDDPILQYSWSVMTEADYHADTEFGVVTGINVPRRADGVTRVRPTPAPKPFVPEPGREAGGVTVYSQFHYDGDPEGWTGDNGAALRLTADSIHGKALQVDCAASWAAARRPIRIRGSRGLKIALLMKGRNLEAAGINVQDIISRDNTTSCGYRYLQDDRWTPILYYLDRFRYNSRDSGYVSPQTAYSDLRFYGPFEAVEGRLFIIDDLTIYRGIDRDPPKKVDGLQATAASNGVRLSWNPAADNVGAQVYVVSRAPGEGPFEKIAESHRTSHLDDTCPPGRHRYRIFAIDFEENFGPWSDPVPVESASPPRDHSLTREEEDRLGFAEHVSEVHARGAGKVRRGHATLFGDSLTGATSYPQCAQAAFRNLTVNAFGFAAMRTSFGRNKVGEILERENPEFLFILYGTNNDKSEKNIPPAMEDLAAIVRAAEDRGTVAFLGTIPPRGWTAESAPEANFNRHIASLCRKLQIPAGYIFEDFQAAGDRRVHMGGDGVHWRGSGMAIAARAWGKALDQVRFALRNRD